VKLTVRAGRPGYDFEGLAKKLSEALKAPVPIVRHELGGFAAEVAQLSGGYGLVDGSGFRVGRSQRDGQRGAGHECKRTKSHGRASSMTGRNVLRPSTTEGRL
jgi:hypothetical protein